MAFSIFSKPVPASSGQARARPSSERPTPRTGKVTSSLLQDQARHGNSLGRFTVTRYGTPTERASTAASDKKKPSLELGPAHLGFSPALENAALLHASGQSVAAREILGHALVHEPDSRALSIAWHAQFDLLQRAGDRVAFDELALEYVAVFERSPPPWEDGLAASSKAAAPGAGYLALTSASVRNALEIPGRAARYSTLRIDVASLTEFEDSGCRRLVDVLRRLRRQSYSVGWQGLDQLWRRIALKTHKGTPQNEGVWLFALEVLQWQNSQDEFEERAIDYAITFEVSPPSWEPLARKQEQAIAAAQPVRREAHVLKGVLVGPADAQITALYDFAEPRGLVQIDMAQVERLDFVCAGSLQNAISSFDANEKEVQIVGASPILHALLALLGVRPDYFKQK